MDMLWTKSREKADPVTVANDHVLAAYAFADETFGPCHERARRVR